ncbi:hypothetical protein J056_004267 [Wallemia ichthyophaga EXF-994]|uniref:50S ribosomal protein L10 n=1 Tax=Wallemia ichthyophaga (strain EXF-994 / CBS 113033) TaxID=1299270 RepID=R9AN00_WALI9|nr:uncharacterized protein J056_004267 [Wallemia ichthyophaga EXF-994]EOR01481.1 hypothetical protein J056_004267 [Wallemia ichthyophaga EXF-994]
MSSLTRIRKNYLNSLYKNLLSNQNLLFYQFNNFNVSQLSGLRGVIDSETNGKASLTVIRSGVFRGLSSDPNLKQLLTGNCCVVSFTHIDPPTIKSILQKTDSIKSNSRFRPLPLSIQNTDTIPANPKMLLLGGHIGNATVDPFHIRHLANLPSLPQIHSQIHSIISNPSASIHSHISNPSSRLHSLLKSHSQQ